MNIKLVRDHGVGSSFTKFKREFGVPENSPFCINFASAVYFIATYHTRDETSSTYKLIHDVINTHRPDVVLIEGVSFKKGANVPLGGWSGESHYASTVASQCRIDYFGGEPNDEEINKKLISQFNKSDIMGMYFMREYKYAYMTVKEPKEKFLADFYVNAHRYITCRGWNHETWFARTFNKTFRWGSFLGYSSPSLKKDAPITCKIAASVSKLRDIYCAELIKDFIAKNKKVVVVMGMNHAYAQFPALDDALGNISIILPR